MPKVISKKTDNGVDDTESILSAVDEEGLTFTAGASVDSPSDGADHAPSDSENPDGVKKPDEVTFKENTASAPPARSMKVKVRTVSDHRCCIGGEWYDFKKGVQKNVPVEVKNILLKANLLMPF